MNNFTQEPARREVNESGLNAFLTRMYGIMSLAVGVSALTAYLSMTVFRTAVVGFIGTHPGMVWLLLLLPIVLSVGVGFSANRSAVGSFLMLMGVAILYGLEFSLIAALYTTANIAAAFVSSAVIFVSLAIYGTVTKRDLSRAGSHAMAALVALIIATLINFFLKSAIITYLFSYIAVIIFIVLTAWDAQKMKAIYVNYGSEQSVGGLAVMGALQLYLDFINLFLQLLQIFGMSNNRN